MHLPSNSLLYKRVFQFCFFVALFLPAQCGEAFQSYGASSNQAWQVAFAEGQASESSSPPAAAGTQNLSASRLRPELDARLKTALRRSLRGDYRLVSLEDLFARWSGSGERKRAGRAYWQVTRLALSVDGLSQALAELETLSCPPERRAYLEAIKGVFSAKLVDLRGQLVQSQIALSQYSGDVGGKTLPFPDDLPHTGGYKTHLASLFPSGNVPTELRRIDNLLPLVRHSIYLHFVASRSARDAWLAYAETSASASFALDAWSKCGVLRLRST